MSSFPYYEPAAEKAKELCKGLTRQTDKYKAITGWLNDTILYDYIRAFRHKNIREPDIKRCFDKKMGICWDVATLAASMFRAIGMRANVAIGRASSDWHAWTEVYVDGIKTLYDQVAERKNRNKKNPTAYIYKKTYTRA